MRRNGRILLTTVAVMLALAGSAAGQGVTTSPTLQNHRKMVTILESALHSDIEGIVEGSIYDAIQYKSYYPDRDFSRLISDLNSISESSNDSAISYKAQVASMYLRYGSSLDNKTSFSPDNHERAFQLASDQLTKKFLLSNVTP